MNQKRNQGVSRSPDTQGSFFEGILSVEENRRAPGNGGDQICRSERRLSPFPPALAHSLLASREENRRAGAWQGSEACSQEMKYSVLRLTLPKCPVGGRPLRLCRREGTQNR